MLSKKLFQKPKNDLENPGRSTKESHPSVPDELCLSCPKCKNILFVSDLAEEYSTCPKCGHLFRMNARQRISMIADDKSFVEHDRDMHSVNVLDFPGYENKLKHAVLNSRNAAMTQALVDAFTELRVATVLMHGIVPAGCELICEYFDVDPVAFFSWDSIFASTDEFVESLGEKPGEHRVKPLPPRFDFFSKHESQY